MTSRFVLMFKIFDCVFKFFFTDRNYNILSINDVL